MSDSRDTEASSLLLSAPRCRSLHPCGAVVLYEEAKAELKEAEQKLKEAEQKLADAKAELAEKLSWRMRRLKLAELRPSRSR